MAGPQHVKLTYQWCSCSHRAKEDFAALQHSHSEMLFVLLGRHVDQAVPGMRAGAEMALDAAVRLLETDGPELPDR